MSGYYCMKRGAMDNPVFCAEPFTRYQAWEWLISKAAWRDRTITVGSKGVELARGQLCKSVRMLAEKWKWEQTKVLRFIRRLGAEKMITTSTATGIMIITICNYELYQLPVDADATVDATQVQQHRNTTATTIEELQELKESKNKKRGSLNASSPPKDSKRGTRLPADWTLPVEWREWALKRGAEPGLVDREAERFGNYWLGAPGSKGVKLDWLATWRNWMLDKLPAPTSLFDATPRKTESREIIRWRGRMLADIQHDYWDFENWGDPWNDPRHEVPQSLLDEFPALRDKYFKLRLVK